MDLNSQTETMIEAQSLLRSEQTQLDSQEHLYRLQATNAFVNARTDFATFIRIFCPPDGPFVFSPFHKLLASVIQGIVDGEASCRRAIACPPQHGKTTVSSKLAAAWLLGRYGAEGENPGMSVAYTSHSNDLCTEVSSYVRDIVQHPYYQAIFPGVEIVFGSNRKDSWVLTNGSHFRSKPAGSKFTGRRIDWLIVDDPHKGREEAESKVQREKVIQWYNADLVSRLSPGAVVFVIQTRWHPEDLIGVLTHEDRIKALEAADAESEIFTSTSIPAICTHPETDPLGREEGQACFPELRNEKFLHNVKQSIPSYEWESQYQQRPRLTGSGNIDFSRLRYIEWDELPDHLELVRHWDLAVSEEQAADYTAGAMIAYDSLEDKFYIAHITRARANWIRMRKEILERARSEAEVYGVGRIGVEAVAGFIVAFQDIKQSLLGLVRVFATKPTKSKLARATPWLNKIEAGRVYIVRGAWNKDFLEELEQFPAGNHDDMVDAVSGGYEMVAGNQRFVTSAKQEQKVRDAAAALAKDEAIQLALEAGEIPEPHVEPEPPRPYESRRPGTPARPKGSRLSSV